MVGARLRSTAGWVVFRLQPGAVVQSAAYFAYRDVIGRAFRRRPLLWLVSAKYRAEARREAVLIAQIVEKRQRL